MWSTPEDRRRAALRVKKLTPAQEKAKAERERAFNAGYDYAVQKYVLEHRPSLIAAMNFNAPSWVEYRHGAFEVWDLDQRMQSSEKA